jgi:transcriptional regulator with GAF, ATPase, and Fis domain
VSFAEVERQRAVQLPLTDSALKSSDAGFVGESLPFRRIREAILTVALRECPVVITGETGTGKEMVARQIHLRSARSGGVLIPVDCASLSGDILESQLFGHVKGAFTGAHNDTLGFFRAADGGTIFLDEIGEIPLDLQTKLLRVLQESAVVPVGSTRPHHIDVRVICATNRDLKQMVREGTFRLDLYFRLKVFKIEVPPLRERQEDIAVLAHHFLQKQAQLYSEPVKRLSGLSIKLLKEYGWPGNVRELANAMEYAHITSMSDSIEPSALPPEVANNEPVIPLPDDICASFEELQKTIVVRALAKSRGRKMVAARLLKMDHRKLDRLVRQFDIPASWLQKQ